MCRTMKAKLKLDKPYRYDLDVTTPEQMLVRLYYRFAQLKESGDYIAGYYVNDIGVILREHYGIILDDQKNQS